MKKSLILLLLSALSLQTALAATSEAEKAAVVVINSLLLAEDSTPVTPPPILNYPISVPSHYYKARIDMGYENSSPVTRYEYEKLSFLTGNKFTFNEYILENSNFVLDTSNQDFSLKNGQWVSDSFEENVTYSNNNKIALIGNIHQLSIKSIEDIAGNAVPVGSLSVQMPTGATKVTWNHIIANDSYGIDSRARTHGNTQNEFYNTLREVIQYQCGTSWITDAKEGSGLKGVSFTCGQHNQNSGTLVGVKDDNTLQANVGTWRLTSLAGASHDTLLVTIDAAYKEDDHQLFAEYNNEIWRGWYNKKGESQPFSLYNQVAFNAMKSAMITTAQQSTFIQDGDYDVKVNSVVPKDNQGYACNSAAGQIHIISGNVTGTVNSSIGDITITGTRNTNGTIQGGFAMSAGGQGVASYTGSRTGSTTIGGNWTGVSGCHGGWSGTSY